MNQFEDIAIKLKSKIVDENLLKNMLGPIFVEEFYYLSDFIDIIRLEKNSPSIMEHWEWIVKRWK